MHEWQSLSHVRWECKYHVVFIPKYRRKVLYGKLRQRIGPILRELCRQKGVELLEGHLMPDHVHMCLSIPPKYGVAHGIGFLKGKSAVRIHRDLLYERRMSGLSFWATGYSVSTVGLDEHRVRQYIRAQEKLESCLGSGFKWNRWGCFFERLLATRNIASISNALRPPQGKEASGGSRGAAMSPPRRGYGCPRNPGTEATRVWSCRSIMMPTPPARCPGPSSAPDAVWRPWPSPAISESGSRSRSHTRPAA